MRERIALAGVEANIGIIVLATFLGFGVLAALGVGVLLATGEVHAGASGVATYSGGVIVVALWARLLIRDVRAFGVVEVADDGSWRLRGPLGVPRGTIAAGVARAITATRRDTWIFGVARRYTQSWGVIEANGRRWDTCRGTLQSNARAIERLQRLASAGRSGVESA